MKILFFVDKVTQKMIHMGNEGRLALADPIAEAKDMSYLLHGLNQERSSKYLQKLKTGEYSSFLEPGSYVDNVKLVEVDFINNTVTEVKDFAENPATETQPKECSKEDCAHCVSKKCSTSEPRTVKQTNTTNKQLTKETKMAMAPKKSASGSKKAPKKSAAPKKAPKKASGSKK